MLSALAVTLMMQSVAERPEEAHATVCGVRDLGPCAVRADRKSSTLHPLALYTTGEALDLASTLYFKSHGVREANPLLQRNEVMIPAKVALVAVLTYMDKKRQPHHRTKTDRIIYVAGRVVLTVWNVKSVKWRNGREI
jgi:hypothetical protein